jgi:hypothetical protein
MSSEARSHLGGVCGSTIVVALILLFAVTALTIAGLSAASSNLRISRNYLGASQALLAAEAGQVHAHERISDWGVVRFDTDVLSRWEEIFGSAWREVPGSSGIRYSASVEPDALDPAGFLILRTVGQAPGESSRTIASRLQVDLVFSPGAIYLPGDSVDATFNGNAFLVDGFDRRLDGTPDPNGRDVPGIAARNEAAREEVLRELNPQQRDNVVGDGGTPSVRLSYGPTAERIRDTIVPNILAQPGVVTNPVPGGKVNGNVVFGTPSSPQITHFTGNLEVRANGNASGAGILVVDGSLTLNGSLDFTGLIVVRGATEITTVSGNATVLGAIWTTSLDLRVAGSASVTYSTAALSLASDLGRGSLLPRRARAISWKES